MVPVAGHQKTAPGTDKEVPWSGHKYRHGNIYKVVPPQLCLLVYNPMKTIDISPINYSYLSYKPT